MPSHWKAKPPSSGPIMRVAAPVAESSAIAGTMRCGPAASPTMRRRVDISVAHIVPTTMLPSAMCHSARCPMVASVASTVDTVAGMSRASMTISLRSTASETAPAKAPNTSCGNCRAATTPVTASADPVTSKANRLEASSSSQRMALAKPPTSHSRRKSGSRSNSRTAGRRSVGASSGEFIVPHAIAADMLQPRRITGGSR